MVDVAVTLQPCGGKDTPRHDTAGFNASNLCSALGGRGRRTGRRAVIRIDTTSTRSAALPAYTPTPPRASTWRCQTTTTASRHILGLPGTLPAFHRRDNRVRNSTTCPPTSTTLHLHLPHIWVHSYILAILTTSPSNYLLLHLAKRHRQHISTSRSHT